MFVTSSCNSQKDTSANLGGQRTLLVNGYSQMYRTTGVFTWTDELLLVKMNSKEIKDFGKRLDEAVTAIGKELEKLEISKEWLVLDKTGSSELQNKLLSSMTKERLKSYAPVVGLSGPIFERTLLLTTSGILNQMKHLTQVMLEVEKDKKRRKFLEMAKKSFENLRDEDLKLLNKVYFKHDQFSKK